MSRADSRPANPDTSGEPARRVQIGLAGIAGVLLVVGIADMALDRAVRQQAEAGGALIGGDAASAADERPSEPLVDLGVSPAPDASEPSANESAKPR